MRTKTKETTANAEQAGRVRYNWAWMRSGIPRIAGSRRFAGVQLSSKSIRAGATMSSVSWGGLPGNRGSIASGATGRHGTPIRGEAENAKARSRDGDAKCSCTPVSERYSAKTRTIRMFR